MFWGRGRSDKRADLAFSPDILPTPVPLLQSTSCGGHQELMVFSPGRMAVPNAGLSVWSTPESILHKGWKRPLGLPNHVPRS